MSNNDLLLSITFCIFLALSCNQNNSKIYLSELDNKETIIKKKPNIIIVLTDDQGWADVGFNGATDIPTPNLDRIAKEGVVFTNGYVSHPYCSPSRAGLLTGRYQARFGHDCNMPYEGENDETIGTPLSEKMISEALKEQGYTTSAIGKWHVGDHPALHPTAQGFDDWFGFPGGGMNYWGKSDGLLRTIYRNGVEVPQKELTYLTDDFTNEALKFIDDNKEKPFFIYLAYNAPHAPDHATKQYLENTKHIEYGGRSVYGAMVNAVDVGIGKIDSTLVANKIKNNTVIVFLSDNGGRKEHADNRPNRGHKGMLFEGGIKVPFCMSWPNGIEANKVFEQPIISLDLFPTLFNIAGGDITKEPQLEGVDLMPFITGKTQEKPHEQLFWRSSGGFEYAVRNGDYKLYKSAYKEKTLLFNLEKDPLERYDISGENKQLVAQLEQEYKNWDSKNIDPLWFDPHAENVSKEEEKFQNERLKSLHSRERK